MDLILTALELGLMSSLTVLALFLSYSMLGVCDLSTDGCFTFGAAVGAVVAISGHPYLAILAAMGAGALSGFVTAFLQTKMGVDSLLSGIVVNTGLYSINIAVMGNSSLLNMNKTETVFTKAKTLLSGSFLSSQYRIFVIVIFTVLVVLFLSQFLKTRIGLAIRATGDNPDMVRSSSINPAKTTIIGLCISNSFTALSGCLLAMYQKSVNVTIGSGMLTIALASLLIGNTFIGKSRPISARLVGAVAGAFIFRLVYTAALRLNMPAFMLKLVSAVIVVIAISGPYLRRRFPLFMRKMRHGRAQEEEVNNA
ncbi:MAG: ABC transporter permease [Spirochaetales bacterium]|nr:ABC transporter permease [Spirochaetales bacterium]MBP5552924.1 ABC transporter permease [Spirochaetales bacterium]